MPLVEDGKAPDGAPPSEIDPATARAYWSKTSGLMWTTLLIWFVSGFLIHVFAPSLNTIKVAGFPIGFYFAAQGSLIIFVVGLYWFARRQNQIDQEHGVQEDL